MNPNTIDAALESHLLTLPGAPSIAWEDVAFTPKVDQAYLQVHQLRNTTIEHGIANDVREDRGILQVTVVHPAGMGKVKALEIAQSVAELFPAGLVLSLGSHYLFCDKHPAIASGYPDEGWYRVPVSINWQTLPY